MYDWDEKRLGRCPKTLSESYPNTDTSDRLRQLDTFDSNARASAKSRSLHARFSRVGFAVRLFQIWPLLQRLVAFAAVYFVDSRRIQSFTRG